MNRPRVAWALCALVLVVALYLAVRPRTPDTVKFNLIVEGTVVSTQVVKVTH